MNIFLIVLMHIYYPFFSTVDSNYINEEDQIYRSTEHSFCEDFFIQIKRDSVYLFGWEVIYDTKDTVYYRSKSTLEKRDDGIFFFTLDNYELTKTKHTLKNLDSFKNDKEVTCEIFNLYSNFTSTKHHSMTDFYAVKHTYNGRSDRFFFEKIN